MCLRILLFTAVTIVPLTAHASREKDHSLTECIQKADIIICGVPLYNSWKDQGDVGVIRVRVHWRYKGKLGEEEIAIAARSFHSKYTPGKPGPIIVKAASPCFFFLKAEVNENGQYVMFDPCDGVIQSNNPVSVEIQNQVRAQNAKTFSRGNPSRSPGLR